MTLWMHLPSFVLQCAKQERHCSDVSAPRCMFSYFCKMHFLLGTLQASACISSYRCLIFFTTLWHINSFVFLSAQLYIAHTPLIILSDFHDYRPCTSQYMLVRIMHMLQCRQLAWQLKPAGHGSAFCNCAHGAYSPANTNMRK